MARITAMQVRRDPLWAPLPPAHPSVATVRRLFHDFCVIAGHPSGGPAPGSYSAADITPLYRGVFYAGDKQLATFSPKGYFHQILVRVEAAGNNARAANGLVGIMLAMTPLKQAPPLATKLKAELHHTVGLSPYSPGASQARNREGGELYGSARPVGDLSRRCSECT